MKNFGSCTRWRWWSLTTAALVLVVGIAVSSFTRADTPATAPSTQPATAPAAVLDKDVDPVTDPSGANGATPAAKKGDPAPTGSLLTPNSYTGWPVNTVDTKTGVATPRPPGSPMTRRSRRPSGHTTPST